MLELLRRAVRHAYFPRDAGSGMGDIPRDVALRIRPTSGDRDSDFRKLADDSIGERIECIGSRPDGGDAEVSRRIGLGPILIALALELPVPVRLLGGRETDVRVGTGDRGLERIVHH